MQKLRENTTDFKTPVLGLGVVFLSLLCFLTFLQLIIAVVRLLVG